MIVSLWLWCGFAQVDSRSRVARICAFLPIAIAVSGCATALPRQVLPQAAVGKAELDGFQGVRIWGDAAPRDWRTMVLNGGPGPQPLSTIARSGGGRLSNLLAISGGAEDGAFGAGLLCGWSLAGTRPSFDLVTGVSSGALIAPFAYLGPQRDAQLREMFTSYSQKDIFSYSVPGLLGGPALADDAPLARLIEKYVDEAFMRDIARERMKGRLLLVGTTNLDAQRPVLWDMGRIAMSRSPQAITLFRKVLLASAALPGLFPPVRIKVRADGQDYDEMHVDGGLTRQVFFAPATPALGAPIPANTGPRNGRLFVIRNGKVTPEWQPVEEKMLSITTRSISTLIKNQSIGDLYRIFVATRDSGIDFNLASIPADFAAASTEPFDRSYMTALFERGFQLASHQFPWLKAPPGIEPRERSHTETLQAAR